MSNQDQIPCTTCKGVGHNGKILGYRWNTANGGLTPYKGDCEACNGTGYEPQNDSVHAQPSKPNRIGNVSGDRIKMILEGYRMEYNYALEMRNLEGMKQALLKWVKKVEEL